jgi:hypothetical protein
MFLNLQKFTKQAKEAYKHSFLDIGNINDGLLISSGFWVVWIAEDRIPNEIKAVVMLLAGKMPEPGKMFRVEKDRPDFQYKIVDTYFLKFLLKRDLYFKLIKTPILLTENHDIRLLQGPDRQVFGINQDYLDMIDLDEIDFNGGEHAPTGPCFGSDINRGIYWYNDFGTVMILPMVTKKIEIPAVLSFLQFKEDGSIERKYFGEAIREALRETDESPQEEQEFEEADAEE